MSNAASPRADANQASVLCTETRHRADDGCQLFVREWSSTEAEAGSASIVVLMHGYAEHSGRYREFAEFLVAAGHPTAAIDARGHGRSPEQRGHIAYYERYVDDLHGFALAMKQRYPNRKLFVLGHSNGGLSALRMVQTRPPVADGLILSSPLFALRPSHQPVPRWVARIMAKLIGRVPVPNNLKPHELTHDQAIVTAHELDRLNIKISTAGWYVAVLNAMDQAWAQMSEVRLPVLVLEADSDPIVVPDAISRAYEALGSDDKELVVCVNAFHELLNELDRAKTYARIAAWLAAHASAGAQAHTA
jgi:alpha-beta hydrolase superfamily lysophospholipase